MDMSKYEDIAQDIRKAILEGEYSPNDNYL